MRIAEFFFKDSQICAMRYYTLSSMPTLSGDTDRAQRTKSIDIVTKLAIYWSGTMHMAIPMGFYFFYFLDQLEWTLPLASLP